MPGKLTLTTAMLAASLALLSACATQPAPMPEQTLYQRLGGRAAIDAVVADSIGNISADARINRRFVGAGAALNKNLADLLCERSGGPCAYTGLDMSAAHE